MIKTLNMGETLNRRVFQVNPVAGRTISLSRRLTVSFVLVLTVMVIVVGGFYSFFTVSRLKQDFSKKIEDTLSFVSGALGPILWTLDQATLEKVAGMALKNEWISGLSIKDHKNRTLFSSDRPHTGNDLIRSRAIYYKGKRVGKIEARFSQASLADNLKTIIRLSILFWLMAICGILLFTKLFVRRFFQGPIESFTDLAESYRQSPQKTPSAPTPFLEFQPIESLVRKLADEVFMQMRQLQEHKERLELAMQFANDGLFDWNLTTGGIYFSPGWKRLLGYMDHEIKNELSEWERLTRPEEFKNALAILDDLLEGRRTRFVAEFQMRHKQGHWVDILARANVIAHTPGGALRVVGTHIDITERKQAEQRLKESEKRLRTLFETAPSIILHLSPEGRILNLNPKAERFLGQRQTVFIGQNFVDSFVPEKEREPFLKMIRAVLEHQSGREFENSVMSRDEARHMSWNTAPFADDDNDTPASILCVGQDITERKRMAFQLLHAQKMEAVGTLAGGIAHDFNNMLGIIVGNISYGLADLDPEDELYEVLSDALKGAGQAQNLTQQLLTFSRGGAPVKKTADLNQLIQESARFVMRGAKATCRFVLAEDLWRVEADKGQVVQVIQNLLINANQAMPRGGVITLVTENAVVGPDDMLPLPAGQYVGISVEDQGVGISPKHLSMVFDPFFTTKQKGSGLGLSTCYSIIKQHGGHISVHSELDRGTRFRIYLPASRSEAPLAAEQPPVSLEGRGRILIMDDQAAILKMAGRMLNLLGFETVCTADGTEALDEYRRAVQSGDGFDLVILDLTVPGGMGGARTLVELRKIDPKVKALVSSGYANDPVMAHYEDYGFCGVVPKPYTKAQITEALKEILG